MLYLLALNEFSDNYSIDLPSRSIVAVNKYPNPRPAYNHTKAYQKDENGQRFHLQALLAYAHEEL